MYDNDADCRWQGRRFWQRGSVFVQWPVRAYDSTRVQSRDAYRARH